MLKKLLEKLIGGTSKRYHMMVIYTVIFVTLCLFRVLDGVTFATFTGAFAAWLGLDTVRQGE